MHFLNVCIAKGMHVYFSISLYTFIFILKDIHSYILIRWPRIKTFCLYLSKELKIGWINKHIHIKCFWKYCLIQSILIRQTERQATNSLCCHFITFHNKELNFFYHLYELCVCVCRGMSEIVSHPLKCYICVIFVPVLKHKQLRWHRRNRMFGNCSKWYISDSL